MCFSQDLTGIWRGYFIQKNFDIRSGNYIEDKYKYEIQINKLPSNSIHGVTYSYKTTFFYGKASLQGLYTKKTKNLIIREVKMLELKVFGHSDACLMTSYLDYAKSKDGKNETLAGTYSSINDRNGTDCGNGIVFLEKVTNSDFEKEDFILKKDQRYKPREEAKSAEGSTANKPSYGINDEGGPDRLSKDSILKGKIYFKPGAEKYIVKAIKGGKKSANKTRTSQTDSFKTQSSFDKLENLADTSVEVPEVLQKRENILSSSFVVDGQDVQVEFLDNGQIDGDTISVYHNNKLVVNKQRLGYNPIILNIHIDEKTPVYEFIAVAENLGAVPPNTALVVITSGSKHYEVNITSDETKNAKILLQYQKPPQRTW